MHLEIGNSGPEKGIKLPICPIFFCFALTLESKSRDFKVSLWA